MAKRTIHFAVSPRLAALLGEGYRSTEQALKELVDNAWDADAEIVNVTLPAPMTLAPIVISDNGHGMTPGEIEAEYLNIARDRRSIKGTTTPRLHRRVKGKLGIGKFSGLAAARRMQLQSVRDGHRATVAIDKDTILGAASDIERIPLELADEKAPQAPSGTTITLSELDAALNFPSPDALRALLYYEYGRSTGFTILVNGSPLDVSDMPGDTIEETSKVDGAGDVSVRFTIVEGKQPRHAGFVLRVGGKIVGKPRWFGLDENQDIPDRLRKRIYGEVAVEGIEGVVTSDWGAIVENSKAYAAISAHVNDRAMQALKKTRAREMQLHRARLSQEHARRLAKLPEHRRACLSP